MKVRNQHILLIGPVTNAEAGLIGGATISFGYLKDYFEKQKLAFSLINTQHFPKGVFKIFNPLIVLCKVLILVFKSDIIFLNSSRGGTKYLAPLLYGLSKLFNKRFAFRPFGGNIKAYTAQYGRIQSWLFKNTVLKADAFFLQTKELMAFYQKLAAKVYHLPTSRIAPDILFLKEKDFKKRFIFLGLVIPEKGIDLILQAKEQLEKDYTIHIYGPLGNQKYPTAFEKYPDIYQGILKKEQVLTTLSNYDVLILPTFYEGEGYPGAIIEAYSLGLPVITTHWKAIPEIVENQQTGILIEPNSAEPLRTAIEFFNPSNYTAFSKNARSYFLKNHDSDVVNQRVVEILYD